MEIMELKIVGQSFARLRRFIERARQVAMSGI